MKKVILFLFLAVSASILLGSCKKEDDNNDVGADTGTFTDTRDDKTYSWVKIGNQVWMVQNLKYLPSVAGRGARSTTTAYNYVYGQNYGRDIEDLNDAKSRTTFKKYGVLYNWPAAMNACPPGWRLPSHDDWTELERYICAALGNMDCDTKFPYNIGTFGLRGTNEGNALKSCRQIDSPLGGTCNTSDHPRWITHHTHYGTDEFGFSALPGGHRNPIGSFFNLGEDGTWWTSTESGATGAWSRSIWRTGGGVHRGNNAKSIGMSVRCLRDD